MSVKNYFITATLAISCLGAAAQASPDTVRSLKQTIYILPGGQILENEKLDSLTMAWGEERVIFMHNEEDDKKGIIHLVRMTDEMMKEIEDKQNKTKQSFAGMLNAPAPDFELTDMEGKNWSLKKLRGKIVVLNFWFTSCPPCIREMPDLNKLVKTFEGKEVVFLGLTYNDAAQVKTFLEKRSFSYRLFPDSREVDKKYNVSSWPTSIVIDKTATIKMIVQSSEKIGAELEAVINTLL